MAKEEAFVCPRQAKILRPNCGSLLFVGDKYVRPKFPYNHQMFSFSGLVALPLCPPPPTCVHVLNRSAYFDTLPCFSIPYHPPAVFPSAFCPAIRGCVSSSPHRVAQTPHDKKKLQLQFATCDTCFSRFMRMTNSLCTCYGIPLIDLQSQAFI